MPATYSAETLQIEGPDAIAFAHAQFSSNVGTLATGQWQFSAWLDPQGRVRVLFHLARIADDRLVLLLRGGNAAVVVDELRRFVFRSKVTLTALPPRALATGSAVRLHLVLDEDDCLAFGCGDYSLKIDSKGEGDDRWRQIQLRDGWPWLPESALNALLPSALSLQRLMAVVIDKGCYPGQEIVARMHYRGGHKRHMHSVVLSQAVAAGEVLRAGERDVGRLLDVVTSDRGVEAVAILNDDFVAQHFFAQHDDKPLTSFDNNLAIRVRISWPA
jgi:folate-binding protein YgfZ